MAVYLRVSGGLGNQLFQYAAGAAVASSLRTDLVVDPSGIFDANRRGTATKREFDLPWLFPNINVLVSKKRITDPIIRIALRHGKSPISTLASDLAYFFDSHAMRSQSLFRDRDVDKILHLVSEAKSRNIVHLNGYWADFRLAELGRAWILSQMSKELVLNPRLRRIEIEMKESRSTVVHVRRGDFLSKWGKIHSVTSLSYFAAAMDLLAPWTEKFYVFSDDIQWCRANLRSTNKDIQFISREEAERDFEHLLLMSGAKHFIISNSSFSWWAAWLGGQDEKRVVRPFAWTKNDSGASVYPPEWDKIPTEHNPM